MDMIELKLMKNPDDNQAEVLIAAADENVLLPRLDIPGRTFLGWNVYERLNVGYMNYASDVDRTLYAITTDGPAYVVESYFRGVPDDYKDRRCQFRRYVVDIYLENAIATSGRFKLENCNYILYYLGHVPVENIDASVTAVTNDRGGPYRAEAYFTTSDITVEWKSESPVNATSQRQKIATLMLCFGKWEMSYREIAKRTSDEIIVPACNYAAFADERVACVSANFYRGVIMEQTNQKSDAQSYAAGETLPDIDVGELLTRFAVLADSHIGVRYNWENYEWFSGIFSHLKALHADTPLDFVLQLGDNIDDGYPKTYKADYDLYLELIKELDICDAENPIENRRGGTIPHYELWGNHDISPDTRFFDRKLWYSENADGKKVAFIAFSTGYGGYPAVNFNVTKHYASYRSYGVISDEMTEFVENSIIEAKQNGAMHVVLCNHFGIAQDLTAPILPESGLGKIENLCKKYGIRLYLNGHEHNFDYTLRKYNSLYDYDASMTHDKYAVFEIYERCVKTVIFNTADNSVARTDLITL